MDQAVAAKAEGLSMTSKTVSAAVHCFAGTCRHVQGKHSVGAAEVVWAQSYVALLQLLMHRVSSASEARCRLLLASAASARGFVHKLMRSS